MTSAPVTVNGHANGSVDREAAELRRLMMCRGEAAERHRTIAGRIPGLDRTEAAAMAALTTTRALSPGALAERLLVTTGAASTLVARLERHGAVDRHAHPHDQRRVVITATDAHLQATAALYAPLMDQLDRLIEQLSPTTRAEALEFLPQATAVLHPRADTLTADRAGEDQLAPLTPGSWA